MIHKLLKKLRKARQLARIRLYAFLRRHKRLGRLYIQGRRARQQTVSWWQRNNTRYGIRWRLANGAVAILVLVAAIIPLVQSINAANAYALSDSTLKLVGNTNQSLAKQLTYDQQSQSYEFNQSAVTSSTDTDNSTSGPNPAAAVAAMKAQVGTASGKGSDKSLYALEVPTDFSKGVTYHDTNTQLSFSLVPQFSASDGRNVNGHLVFPLNGSNQAIYTLKNNGLKEDIVVPKVTQDSMAFSYTLDLPDTLQAKVIPNSGGNIGIYSADPTLFGKISYGDSTDQANIQKARVNGAKTNLIFGLPSPVVKDTQGDEVGSARFQLNGDSLSVIATGLSDTKGAITIDPSVVVTSTSDFITGGNNDGNIDFSTSGQITRGGLTGGSLSGGWQTTNGFTTGREQATTLAYNGYIYEFFGVTGGNGSNVNDIQYAPINADGSVGTWQSLGAAGQIYYATIDTAVAYNGFVYLIGGYQYNSVSQTTNRQLVTYAPVNSNGTFGTWQSVQTLPQNITNAAIVGYNGYMYIAGGGPNGGGGSYYSNTYYATVNQDGSLGTWVAGTNLTEAVGVTQGAVYNGYMYVVGGAVSGYTADVEYAKINADGSLGTWQQTTPFVYGRDGEVAYAYGGYLYVTAGIGTNGYGSVNGRHVDTQYAPINANGTVGAWQRTTNLASSASYGMQLGSGVAYNGYLYYLGGRSQDGTTDSAAVQYAKIDPAGATSEYTTSGNTFTTTRRGNQTVASGGYLYVMGGDNGSTPVATIYRAAISSNGSVGSFSANGSLPANLTYFASAVYNGYIYAVGGCTLTYSNCSVTGPSNAVYSAPITAASGIGSWSTQTTFPTAAFGLSAVAYNGMLYVLGGAAGTSNFMNTIYYTSISNGSTGSWNTSAQTLPTGTAYTTAVMYSNILYLVGGCTGGGTISCNTTTANVYYAPINSGGDLSAAFTASTPFTTARGDMAININNGYIYITGGRTGSTYYSDTQFGKINNDNSITWNTAPDSAIQSAEYGIGSAVFNGVLYLTGGYNGSTYYNNVQYASLNNGGQGATGSWTTSGNTFTTTRYNQQSVAYNGYLYVMGGQNSGNTPLNDVQYAPINADGSIGAWVATTSFNNARYAFGATAYNGYLYIMGGNTGGTNLSDVQYAPINADGSIGAWVATTSFPTVRYYLGAVAYNNYLYIYGGWGNSGTLSDVQYAPINANGTIGAWAATTSFPTARYGFGSFVYSGYLYVAGGNTSTSSTALLNDVQYAPINANGTIGAWAATTSFPTARYGFDMTAYNGYIYLLGGYSGSYLNDVQYAPINANGTIGVWAATTSFTNGRSTLSSVVYNGNIYMLGGISNSVTNTYYNDTQYAPVSSIARTAHYSKVIDFGSSVNVNSIIYNPSTANGSVVVTYRSAGSNGLFGTNKPAGVGVTIGVGGCTGATTYTRYLLLTVTLDDSTGQAAGGAFPDANSPHANLTDLTINYTPAHPAPNIRLRTGQTLQSGNLSVFDTCN